MNRGSIEQLFAAWREDHDRSALGEVFDATAPELFKVAVHLARDAALAEDLVQSTFLAAIESAAGWRADSPLFPWLLGILVNKLRMQRRRNRQALRWNRIENPEPSPLAAAQVAELEANLHRCLSGMDEAYRAPLILHLEHHLTANEIAAAIDRPPGTVRSQISRGLEHLRRALPPGIATLAAVGTLSAATLARLRSAVLDHAAGATTGAAGATAATFSLAGILAMNLTHKLTIAVVAAIALGLAFYVATASAAADRVPEPGGTRQTAVDRTESPGFMNSTLPSGAGEEQRSPAGGAATQPSGLLVRVTWHDGSPAQQVSVLAEPSAENTAVAPTLRALHTRSQPTDTDGIAFFAALAGAFDISTPRGGKASVTVPPGERATLDLVLPRGIDLAGVVVDAADQSIAGAEILLGRHRDFHRVARTDEAGRFSVRSAGADRWIAARADGYSLVQALRIEKHGSETMTLRLPRRAGGVIEGRVVDSLNAPVEGALVVLGPVEFQMYPELARMHAEGKGLPPPHMDRSDAEGRFRIACIRQFHADRLVVGAAGHAIHCREVLPHPERPLHVEIALEAGVVLSGTVRAPDGEPVERAFVWVRTRNSTAQGIGDSGPEWSRSMVVTDAGGHYRIDHLPSGTLDVAVTTHGKRAVGLTYRKFTAVPGQQIEWNPLLDDRLTIHGVLQREDGSPIAGWSMSAETPAGLPRPEKAITAADGSFALQPCAPVPHVLITNPDSGPGLHHSGFRRKNVSPGHASIAFVVGDDAFPSAVVTGRLVDDGGATLVGIEAWVESGGSRSKRSKFDSGARFEFGPLPPGRIRVLARHPERGELFSTTFDLRPEQRLEVGDLRFARPGSLELVATDLDGAPMPYAIFCLVPDQGYFASRLDLTDGRGRAGILAPGRYFLSHFGNSVFDTRPIIVRPGETTHVRTRQLPGHKRVFHFHYAGLEPPINCRALWQDPAGELLGRASLHLWQEKEFTAIDFHFAAGSYRLELELPDGRRIAQEFTVTGQDGEPPVVVRLR